MTKPVSDAPLTVNGVTETPTWPWSKEYRAHVADTMRQNGKTHLGAGEADQRYVDWYAERHGVSVEVARQRIEGPA